MPTAFPLCSWSVDSGSVGVLCGIGCCGIWLGEVVLAVLYFAGPALNIWVALHRARVAGHGVSSRLLSHVRAGCVRHHLRHANEPASLETQLAAQSTASGQLLSVQRPDALVDADTGTAAGPPATHRSGAPNPYQPADVRKADGGIARGPGWPFARQVVGSVAELLLAFLKDLKNQKLAAPYQHI